jgi:hypothetical protein
MRKRFSTINDLIEDLAETMDLHPDVVQQTLHEMAPDRNWWGRFEDITAKQYAAIAEYVYASITGQPFPKDWEQQLFDAIEEEERQAAEMADFEAFRSANEQSKKPFWG